VLVLFHNDDDDLTTAVVVAIIMIMVVVTIAASVVIVVLVVMVMTVTAAYLFQLLVAEFLVLWIVAHDSESFLDSDVQLVYDTIEKCFLSTGLLLPAQNRQSMSHDAHANCAQQSRGRDRRLMDTGGNPLDRILLKRSAEHPRIKDCIAFFLGLPATLYVHMGFFRGVFLRSSPRCTIGSSGLL
jgi:hypothetical protein